MKFKTQRDAIIHEISIAYDIVGTHTNASILSNVLIKTDGENELIIRSTDLRIGFETKIPVEVLTKGSTTVFCDKLLEVLRSCPDGEMEFETIDGDYLSIKPLSRSIEFRIRSAHAEKFPELQTVPDDSYFDVPQSDFIDMIDQTIFSVSTDETRYFMNGVYIENIDNNLTMVATDGRRLSYISRPFGRDVKTFETIIVPPKALNLIRKLLSGEGSISISVDNKHIFAKVADQCISSTLIEGQFPNYKRVIPKEQTHSVIVNRADLSGALKRVSIFVEKTKRIFVRLKEKEMGIYSNESEKGNANEQIPCDYSGPEMQLALNYIFLADPARVIKSDSLAIRFTTNAKAVSIFPVPDSDYFHIIMPMQVD